METDGTQPAVPDLLSCLTKRKGEGYLIFCCCNPNFHQIKIMIVISHLTLLKIFFCFKYDLFNLTRNEAMMALFLFWIGKPNKFCYLDDQYIYF